MSDRLFEKLTNHTNDDKKYCLENIYIGNIAKKAVSKNGAIGLAQIIYPSLLIFEYRCMDFYNDIENNKMYPLNFRRDSNIDDYYIPEKWLYQNTQRFRDMLERKHISIESEFNIEQIRKLVDELQQKHENLF